RAGRDHRILAIRGFADRPMRRRADAAIDILDVSGALAKLDEWKPSGVAFAGAVTRPTPAVFLGALSAVRNSGELKQLLARGDDHLLRSIVNMLEERGHRVLGAHEIAPDLLVSAGQLGRIAPSDDAQISIATGFRCLADLSPSDIGQALVVVGERVTAIEGAEGTDRMLRRVRSLSSGFLRRAKPSNGILVKSAKRGQELRIDLPALGPRTVQQAAAAGLAGIALGAKQTLVIERERMIAEADRLGLFLVAVEPDTAMAGETR
ncbi:MAG TPA: UDP-2,3-diacylglucosamine diphosphatase LpxI, partial [Saliniramus sp.]|nr:UDP-2,3-diacylglucosamine diphosphatase LpxI [Saliniramus sp.]